MSSPSPTSDCDDRDFNFQQGWSYTGLAIVVVCSLFVFIDAIRHNEKRKVPGKLMICRTAVDLIWALLFFYMILEVDCDSRMSCHVFGTLFTFLFLLSLMYFGCICWDMYFTLVNPFRRPISDSWQLHSVSIVLSLVLALTVTIDGGYEYRKDYQICWTTNTNEKTSPNNLIILYLPLGTVIVCGIGVTVWAIQRLQTRMLEETFELRWAVIKRQISIVSFFTVNYVIAGCIWCPIVWITFKTDTPRYGPYGAQPSKQPYLLSVTIVVTVIFDGIAWIHTTSKQSKSVKSKSLLLPQPQKPQNQNLSNALRREVIVFITHGLVQSIRRTAKETQETQNNYHNLDVWDADFDANIQSTQSIQSSFEEQKMMDNLNYLNTFEPEPQNVYFPDSIGRNPAQHRGAMDRFNIEIDANDAMDGMVPFTDFAPHVFRYLRLHCYGVSDCEYLESILPNFRLSDTIIGDIISSKFSEGRSSAFFYGTTDNKYLIKTLAHSEAQLLVQILANYLAYFKSNPQSYLTKFYGLHSIKLYSLVIHFVVMGCVIEASVNETYDIKGSWVSRLTNHHSDEGKLMLDQDLHKQLLLDSAVSARIHRQLQSDTHFLENEGIMDYSLLVGICYTTAAESAMAMAIPAKLIEGPGIYYIGVIDILQSWNWAKKLERLFKVYLRCMNKDGISCVEPTYYRNRFLRKMDNIGITNRKPSSVSFLL